MAKLRESEREGKLLILCGLSTLVPASPVCERRTHLKGTPSHPVLRLEVRPSADQRPHAGPVSVNAGCGVQWRLGVLQNAEHSMNPGENSSDHRAACIGNTREQPRAFSVTQLELTPASSMATTHSDRPARAAARRAAATACVWAPEVRHFGL